jgi:hypothetical protein
MLFIITIVLDGMKFLPIQLATFNRLKIPWRWIVIEGQARNVNCTAWTAEMPPRLSEDGSTQWLTEMRWNHPNVIHAKMPSWNGKLEMFNYAMTIIHAQKEKIGAGDAVVMECDVDELWEAIQLETIVQFFETSADYQRMQFHCRYFLGPNIIITSRNTYGNHDAYEWYRAWRYFQSFKFLKHEAPEVNSPPGKTLDADTTEAMGLVFDHQAYFYEDQVRYKEKFYQYPNAVEQWRALQSAPKPCRVGDYLKWVTDGAMCDRVVKI